jgi:hypothetical protein
LASGSLLLVEPLLVSAVLFVLPLGARPSRQRVRPSDWGWALALTAALTVFILLGRPRESAGQHPASALAWTVVFVVALPLVVGPTLGVRRAAGRLRAALLAAPVAVLLGLTAVLTKVGAHRVAVSGWHGLLTVPAPYAFVVLAVSVTVLQQSAFNAGALQASVPVMLVGEPVVAVMIGVIVLGEGLTVHGLAAPALVVVIGAMTAATIALARGSGAHSERLGHTVRSDAASPDLVSPRPYPSRCDSCSAASRTAGAMLRATFSVTQAPPRSKVEPTWNSTNPLAISLGRVPMPPSSPSIPTAVPT